MTVTLEEARANLPQFVNQATAGEEIVIVVGKVGPSVRLVPVASKASRLTRHPDLIGSTRVFDSDALTQPLPGETWGWLAEP